MTKDTKKYTWFTGTIEEGKEYVVAVTFDLINGTANIGKFLGIKTSTGNVRLAARGETDIISLPEFFDQFPKFQQLVTPAKVVSEVTEDTF